MIAADMNLSAVTNASGFEIRSHNLPVWINKSQYFTQSGSDMLKIKKEINDKIYFEYHNAVNISTYKKEFDLIIARDLSYYLAENDYKSFIQDLIPKIVSNGLLMIGDNETLPASNYLSSIGNNLQKFYLKK
jgi:chemotaxis methyl-accepting protein methylase